MKLNENQIKELISLSIEAGKTILRVYDSSDFEIESKSDNSPLTKADRKSHAVIEAGLKKIQFNDETFPILSEEGKNIPYIERSNWNCYWLVDPLDGTKEFIKRNGEFTVNIALINKNVPIAGFVYVPVQDTIYFGIEGVGAHKVERASVISIDDWRCSSEKLCVSSWKSGSFVNLVASRSHLSPETDTYIKEVESKFGKTNIVTSGSSIKLCMVADGTADVYPRFAPTMEWDTAAAHAVCLFAGAKVMDWQTGKELEYNKENLLNNWFLVSNNKSFEELK